MKEDVEKFSEWNSAGFKMRRLHDNLNLLNTIRLNLTAYNPEYGKYNYELFFYICSSIHYEISPSLSDEEEIELDCLRTSIKTALKKFQIYKIQKDLKHPYKQKSILNLKLFEKLEEWLLKYEYKVRKYQDAHGMDTSYEEEALF